MSNKCPIWGTQAETQKTSRDGINVDSARAGGRYFISGTAEARLVRADEFVKARLTTWLVEQHRLGVECPEVTGNILDEAERRRGLTAHERADRVLREIQTRLKAIGDTVKVPAKEPDETLLAWSESVTMSEVTYLLDHLMEVERIQKPKSAYQALSYSEYNITPAGYVRLEEIGLGAIDSKQAFVAMWFDQSMIETYDKGIAPAVWESGYEPLRIDRKDHNNKIDDEIIAEIRRSRFVVADFTHGDKGMRGGVYYEAGFAHGLNRPVVFTCREDCIEKVHFDTRQYNHITWAADKLGELRKALSDRISATIGDGPLKTNS